MVPVRTPTEILESLFSHAVQEGLLTSTSFRRGRFGVLFAALASEMGNWEGFIQESMNEGYLVSATDGDNVEKIAAPLRYRAPAKPSKTTLVFSWDIPYEERTADITIPLFQIIETVGIDPIQYVTMQESILYKEEEYIRVKAQSRLTGHDTYVGEETLTVMEPRIQEISVINEEESWGGSDQESIEELRTNAMIARYALEKGTKGALEWAMREEGFYTNNYNLVENKNGHGNFAIYVDTTIDEEVEYLKKQLFKEKAAGIYMICQKATPLYVDFNFIIKIANDSDLTPKERQTLKQDIAQAFTNFIGYNGVGKKIMMSKATHYIYEAILEKYDIYDIQIDPLNLGQDVDEDNNILLEDYEVAKINTINVEVVTDLR
ncbi:MAG: baseplate J/gp47 family protein [Desulfosporosinus sp.]